MYKNQISLGGDMWKLCYAENSRVIADGRAMNTIAAVEASGFDIIPAVVPGNLELDLYRAGKIPDPYYSTNTIGLQKLECLHMFYYTRFDCGFADGDAILRFEGLDTVADIYVNGELAGSADNMFIAHEFEPRNLREQNEIVVHIKPAVIEARKHEISPASNALPYNYDSLYIRKAGSMYGWDIMPRIVSGGIWREVFIAQRKAERILNVFGSTNGVDPDRSYGQIVFFYNLKIDGDDISQYRIRVKGVCGDSSFEIVDRLWFTSGRVSCDIHNAKLWWPRNYGEANLYDTVFELYRGDELLDSYRWKSGIRTVSLDRTSTTDADGNGRFQILVNGRKIFCMGTNWVPIDALHSNDVKRLPDIMPMLNDIGCNIVRCWGGNVYEHEDFFDFCDENGILIWQDFAMGCAVYPQEQEFLDILRPEIISIIKKYRNHAALAIWAGDNECDCAYMSWGGGKRRDPNDNIITRRLIPDLLRAYDYTRPYLPSSPYIDEEAFKSGKPTSEEHCWGPRDYFKGDYYRNTVCHFASETGYHGCPSVESLKKFIAPDKLWHWYDPEKKRANDDWMVHAASMQSEGGAYAYRIPLMSNQVKTLFGSEPETLEDFSLASQISQAEAKKYFIERFRFTKWRRTGIIWWNLIDGWPQISDAVVDYYYDKKLAYYYIKRSQQPLCVIGDEEGGVITLYGVNDTRGDVCLSYTVKNLTDGSAVLSGEAVIKSDESTPISEIKKREGEQCFYLIEWNGGRNHFMSGMPDIDFAAYKAAMIKAGFERVNV